ncbi:head GIN domain-containing protein [Hymenobacter coalescens]
MNTTSTLRTTLAVLALTGFSAASAWAQDAQNAQTRPVEAPFERIEASGTVTVVVQPGPVAAVAVQADPAVLARIHTDVAGGTLKIYRDGGHKVHWPSNQNLRIFVYVTCPRLTGVTVTGASELKSTGSFTADDFSIRASGASDVTLQLTAKTLTASASGASDIRLTGRVERQQVQVSGASDYRAYALQSQQADVQASGASDAFVYVDGELTARRSGASDVHYKGKARLK